MSYRADKPKRGDQSAQALLVRWMSLCTAVSILGCSHSQAPKTRPDARIDANAVVAQIQNSDIVWDGSVLGLIADVEGDASARALAIGPAAVPPLLEALNDPARFVAAHVLLSKITGKYRLVPSPLGREHAGERWNGLRVDLDADGRTAFCPSDIPVLRDAWREWYVNQRH